MSTHLIVVPLEDHAGELARAARCLTQAGVDMDGFSVGPGGARFLIKDPTRAADALEAAGLQSSFVEVAPVHIENRPGELARLCEELAAAGVNIEQGFGLTVGGQGRLYVGLDDMQRAGPIIAARTERVVVHRGLRRI